jgi:hypothetical protein
MISRFSILLTLLTVLSLPAQALPTYSQIKYIAQRICKLPPTEIPQGVEIEPGKTEFYYDPKATAIYNQEIGKLLYNGDLLPIEFVNEDIMKPINNRLAQEIYAECQRRMKFGRNLDAE